jgi:hypothetical protein
MEYNDAPLWPVLLIIFLIIVCLLSFWISIIWLISHLGGWHRLAQRYHSIRPTTGKVWRWQYGSINWVGYNGVLILTANAEGVFLELSWFFSFGHNRIFIPWHEFHEAKIKKFLFWRQVQAKVGSPPVATVRLPAVVFEESDGYRVLQN